MTWAYIRSQSPISEGTMQFANIGILTVCLLTLSISSLAAPVDTRPVDKKAADFLDIKIEASRPTATAGTGLGITADFKNVSGASTVYLYEDGITLTLPPELEGPFRTMTGWYGYFPTEPHDPNPQRDMEIKELMKVEGYQQKFPVALGLLSTRSAASGIALQPGETYRVVWTRYPTDPPAASDESFLKSVMRQMSTELRFLFFSPGDYKIAVNAKYWTDPKPPADAYRLVVQSAVLPVAAPQFVILVGAAIGGLIAYFILPQAKWRQASHHAFLLRAARFVLGAIGACLLSAIVTILLSRVSETQFLVRVTVNDLWGAMAIGFVANYIGTQVLDRMIAQTSVRKGVPQAEPAARNGVPVAPIEPPDSKRKGGEAREGGVISNPLRDPQRTISAGER